MAARLRTFGQAVSYPPNQVFIGNLAPDALERHPRPWFDNPIEGATSQGVFGEIVSEDLFIGVLESVDTAGLMVLEAEFAEHARRPLSSHALVGARDGHLSTPPASRGKILQQVEAGAALLILGEKAQIAGCVRAASATDEALAAPVLLENLACKASAVLALRHLLRSARGTVSAEDVSYVLSCGEEAVGDRFQRGGGGMAKAIAESSGCTNATGADVKAFCGSPLHALVAAGALVQSGVFPVVAVVAGGSLAKLGMNAQAHLRHGMPVLEDVLGAFAVLVSAAGDGPALRLDSVGTHTVGARSSPRAIISALVETPLERMGWKITSIDKFAMELHNPEITEPAGGGDIPRLNYRMLGSLAAHRGEAEISRLDEFVKKYGMTGYSPTQGHIAAAIPFLGHALRQMRNGSLARVMLVAKGSLFLGRMTPLSDGVSVIIEAPKS